MAKLIDDLESIGKEALLGFLVIVPWVLYDSHDSSMFMAMISGVVFLLLRMYVLGCFEDKSFYSYALGTSLLPALVLFLHDMHLNGKVEDETASWLVKKLPGPLSLWQIHNMTHVIQIIVTWNSCFVFSIMKTNGPREDRYDTYKRKFRIAMLLVDVLLVTLSFCGYQSRKAPMVLLYLCMLLSSLGIQYIKVYLSLRPFELCFLSSLYFGFLFAEFHHVNAPSEVQEHFSHTAVIIVTTKICTFLFAAAVFLCGILFIMDVKAIRENIMLLVLLVVFVLVVFEFTNAHGIEFLPSKHMTFIRLFVFGSFGLGAYVSIVLGKGLNEFCIIYAMISLVCLHFHVYSTTRIELIQWLVSYSLYHDRNIHILGLYVTILILFIPLIPLAKKTYALSTITSRKLFHLLAVVLFSFDVVMCHTLLHVAMAAATVVFFLVEVFKVIQLSPDLVSIQDSVRLYVAPYLDKRDKNRPIILSHVYLLLGCALPVWIANISKVYSVTHHNDLLWGLYISLMPIGVVTVGVGDAIAAVVGSNFGRLKWIGGSNRTIEGTLAGYLSSLFIWYAFYRIHWMMSSTSEVFQFEIMYNAFISLTLASLLEAITDEPDNLVVPLHTVVTLCALHFR